MKAALTGKIKDNGGLEWSGDVSHFLVRALEVGMAVVIRSLCSTFHTIYIAMNCLFVACSGGQRWKHSCGCQKDVWISLSLPVSLSVSLLCVHVCVCVFSCVCVCEELWQTKLDSVGGVNSITFFFSLPAAHFWIWFSPSSKANQIDTYWKRRFVHDWIFTWAALTGMAVNL